MFSAFKTKLNYLLTTSTISSPKRFSLTFNKYAVLIMYIILYSNKNIKFDNDNELEASVETADYLLDPLRKKISEIDNKVFIEKLERDGKKSFSVKFRFIYLLQGL